MVEILGWLATGLFAISYLSKNPIRLRLIQFSSAILWIGYGFCIGAKPVIAANLLVASFALVTALRSR